MLWRVTGSARSMFGCSRRTMSGKRLLIGVLCAMCLSLGVYIKYFNHESADNLLAANREELHGKSIDAKPNFQRFKSHRHVTAAPAAPAAQHDPEIGNDKLVDQSGNAEQLERTFDHVDEQQERKTEHAAEKVSNKERETNAVEEDREETNKLKVTDQHDTEDENVSNNVHQEEMKEVKEEVKEEIKEEVKEEEEVPHQQDIEAADHKDTAADGDAVVVPVVEHVEGEVDKEEDSQVRDAGGNGGEHSEEPHDAGNAALGRGEDGDGGHVDGRGPHGLKPFDWDKWVKENDLVELGNIWGYCDDENPPVIGKILLLPDDEKGGLKNVIVFNITTEYDIVMGKLEVSIDFNDVHFYSNKFDLEDLEEEGEFFKAPIAKGDHYFVREQHISSLIPKGHYYGEARMLDQNDKMVLCSTMNLNMK